MLATDQLVKNDNRSKSENIQTVSSCQGKPIVAPNYVRYVHDGGVRKGDDVLVVGQVCDAALQALAKRVVNRGSLTIIDSDMGALDAINTKASNAMYTYFQPLYDTHPAFDLRPISSQVQPVGLQTHLLETNVLPFSAETFDIVWIASLPEAISLTSQPVFQTELKRVTKSRGRIARLTLDEDHMGLDTTPSFSLQITYL